jgi:hypothetical protein
MVGPLVLSVAAMVAASPTLKVVDRDPLVVRGDHFRAGEHVTVTALTGLGPRVVRTTARNGVFRVTFRLPDQACAAPRAIRARGDLGSLVTLPLPGPRICVPPPRD